MSQITAWISIYMHATCDSNYWDDTFSFHKFEILTNVMYASDVTEQIIIYHYMQAHPMFYVIILIIITNMPMKPCMDGSYMAL